MRNEGMVSGALPRMMRGVLAAALLATAASGTPSGTVGRILVELPEGHAPRQVLELLRFDEGRPLDAALIDRHVDAMGTLGWVGEVDVDIDPRAGDLYDVTYRLWPRGEIREVRILGNHFLGAEVLRDAIRSREGQTFDLSRALDDGLRILEAYASAGLPFSGVLSSEDVHFEDGVLTFQVTEARLADPDLSRLAAPSSRTRGPLTREALVDLLADGEIQGLFELEDRALVVDRSTGEVRLAEASSAD